MLLVAVSIGSLIVGAALGIAFRFLVLIPATLILIAIALLSATWSTAEVMLVASVGVQVGYFGGAAARMRVAHRILRGPSLAPPHERPTASL
jgi:hypothetical protein